MVHNDPPSGTRIIRFLHSQFNITCHVERIDSILWVLVTLGEQQQQDGGEYTQITRDDARFVISGESMEILTVVDFDEELNGAIIACQIPYHGDIDIGNYSLILAGM